MAFQEGWIIVNEVPTHILTWGGWIEGPIPDGDSIIVCISGNPGVTPFYNKFLASIHQQIGVPVWILSHAGHELPPKSTNMKMPTNDQLFTLSGQVKHKADFVEKYVPKDRGIFFIGHSAGAKIVSELLKNKNLYERTKKGYLIFPTLERIADTPNGKFLIPIVTYGLSFILFLAWVYSCVPDVLRWVTVRMYYAIARGIVVDNSCMEATLHLTLPPVLRSVFFMAMDEMEHIKELDVKNSSYQDCNRKTRNLQTDKGLNQFGDKLKIYFGVSDGWAPLTYYESLKAAQPNIDVSVIDKKFQHTFVLDTPEETATILSDEIKKERSKV